MQRTALWSVLKNSPTADAAAAAAIAAALALPLLGFRLVDSAQGLTLETRLLWVIYAALAVFVGRLALNILRLAREALHPRAAPISPPQTVPRGRTRWAEAWCLGLLIIFASALPWLPFGDRNTVDRATLILIYVVLATGLSIVVGLAGLLDLGYVAFYAVGAYSYALLSQHFHLTFWECLPISGLLAAGFGLAVGLPVLRLRGDYLAIVTLGFGEIIHVVLVNWTAVTGGPNGIGGVPRPDFFGIPFAAAAPDGGMTFAQYFGVPFSPVQRIDFLYYLILAIAVVGGALVWRLRRLPLGRAWEALRENEIACVSLGLNPTMIKLSAFMLGATFAGVAGAFFAARQGFISPESFTFIESALILAIVVLGGMGSQLGIVLAAIVLVGLPEWFRELADYRMLAFGAAMILIMIWRPRGLSGERRPTARLKGVPQLATPAVAPAE